MIQSSTVAGDMYFCVTTRVHRLETEMSHQQAFVVRALEKMKNFLIPQPPRDFGDAILSHFA
jgi:hypothetical protein